MDGALLALHAGLDAVLLLQDGIIRRDQAMAAGLSGSTVASSVYRGSWIRALRKGFTAECLDETLDATPQQKSCSPAYPVVEGRFARLVGFARLANTTPAMMMLPPMICAAMSGLPVMIVNVAV